MTHKEWVEMLNKLVNLPEEAYWDEVIVKLNAMRSDLEYLQIQRKPFTTRALCTE